MTLVWAGFLLGCAFGVAARLSRFCLLRGLRQQLQPASPENNGAPALQAFALALAVALSASQALAFGGYIDLNAAQVVRAHFSVTGVLLGGLLFGAGMVLARSCGARALVLLAGGNLRALVTLLCLGLAAQATLTGVLAPVRQWLQGWRLLTLEHATLPQQLHAAGVSNSATLALAAGLPSLVLMGYALWQPALRKSALSLCCSIAIGALVTALWWITAHVGVDPFDPAPLTSLSFVGPVAEGLLYLQLAVGRSVGLGPAMVAGTLAGAFLTALLTGNARWESFTSPKHLAASASGGLLMGLGGVLAVGCSIGQGLSGLSTLAFASLPACIGIVVGALLVLKLQATFFKS